jgi:ribosome-binding factor A
MENNIKRTTINGVLMSDLEVAQAYIQNLEGIIADRDVTIEGLKRENKIVKRDLVGKNVIINNLKAQISEME